MVDADMDNEITVKDALASVGLFDRPGESAVLMIAEPVRNVLASDYADRDVQAFGALYHASGLFRPYGIQKGQGRRQENLARVVWLTLDCDLIDWLGYPKGHPGRENALAIMWAASQAELDDEVRTLRGALETALSDLGLPLHRLDYTGYGVCGYVYLAEDDQLRIDSARQAHKEIIARINEQTGLPLVDVQSSDAGTRVTRVPGSLNRKGPIARTVTPLIPYTGETWRLTLEPAKRPSATPTAIPQTGAGLAHEDVQQVVDALAPHWAAGQRHDLALAFAGMLAKARVPEDQALAIIAHLATADQKPWDRANAVKSTYARARAGFTTGGFMRMQAIVPPSVLDFVDGVLTRYRTATAPRVTVNGDVDAVVIPAPAKKKPTEETPKDRVERVVEQIAPPPDSVYYGWFGRYRAVMAPTSEAPDQYHLAAALTFAGAMIGRHIHTEYSSNRLFPNLYTTLIGRTNSTRKDTAIGRATNLPSYQTLVSQRLIRPPFQIQRDISSAEGLVKMLAEYANLLLYITEFSTLLKNAQRKGTTTILDKLIEAWDTPTSIENNSKLNGSQAKNPYLSIIAATQPGRIAQGMTSEEIESGFANRWLYVFGASKGFIARPPKLNKPQAYDLYLELADSIATYQDGTALDLSSDAIERWDAWYLKTAMESRESDDEDEADMRGRHAPIIQKIALIFAVTDRAQAIELRHLEPAITFVEWSWNCVREVLREWGTSSDIALEARIASTLKKRGPLPRRDLQRICSSRRWSSRDFAMVVKAMAENQTILTDPRGYVGLPGQFGEPL